MEKGEIVIYKESDSPDFQIEVRVEDETVWLNRHQLAVLFNRDVKTIGKHILNALKEELRSISVVAKFATTATDGKIYQVEYYNLEMIISVGYRVKSDRGIQFRIWANKIIKEYLLRGYAVNQRFERIESDLFYLKKKVDEFDFYLNTNLPPKQGIFFDGQVFDAWQFVSRLIRQANQGIVLIDNYPDETVLALLDKRKDGVSATIYTSKISRQFEADLQKHNLQYEPVIVKTFSKSHDRFLIIDEETIYHIGASLKDLGKKWFAFSKINVDPKDLLMRI